VHDGLVGRLRRVFAKADLPLPEDPDDPAAYAPILRQQAVRDAANLDRGLQPVMRELGRFHPDLLRVEPAPFGVWLKDSAGSGCGIAYRSVSDDVAWTTYWVADTVQDAAIDALWGERKIPTWPECPDHPNTHPLKPELVDDTRAVWMCPTNLRVVCDVGRLCAAT
jgi:hypothetical protein